MRSVIGGHSAGVVPEPSIGHEEPVFIVRDVGGWPQIKVPVQSFRRTRVRRSPDSVRGHVQVIPDAHEMHGPELATLNDPRHFAKVGSRTVLRTRLNHPVVAARRCNHRAAFFNRVRKRLFHVYVLARLAGQHRRDRVPVVRRRDHDRIHALLLDQVPEIAIRPAAGPGPLLRRCCLRIENVAHGGDLHVGNLPHQLRHQASAPATPNQPDVDPVVCAHNLSGRKGASRTDRRGLDNSLDELASLHQPILPLASPGLLRHPARFLGELLWYL